MSEPTTPSIPPVPGQPLASAPEGVPAPRYGEFAPVESAQPVAPATPAAGGIPAAPGQPAMYSGAPVAPQTPAAAPAYAQAAPVYGQPGFAGTPAPKRRTWDLVLTIILLVLGAIGMLIGIFYGIAFSSPQIIDEAFRQQGLGGFDGEIGATPLVIIASHVILYLVAAGLSILLLVKKKIAFYVPLIAGVVAAIIFWTALVMLMMSAPSFGEMYGA